MKSDWLHIWFLKQRHPDPKLQTLWKVTQLAVLLLPFSSLLSSLGILFVAIAVWQQRFRAIVRRPINRGFAVLSLLMLLSTALAFKRLDAFLGLFNFLPFFFAFAALSELIQTPAQLRRLAWLVVLPSVPVVAIGLGQQFFGWSGQVQVLWLLVDWVIDPTGNPPGRMASIFFYANVLASYLAITFSLSLGLWVEGFLSSQRSAVSGQWSAVSSETRNQKPELKTPQSGSKLQNSKLKTQNSLFMRLCLLMAVLGNAIALILTDSRNAWAIAVFACLAYALYLRWLWLLGSVGVVASSILGAAFAPVPLRDGLRSIVPAFFWARLTDQLYTDRPVAQLRSTQWHVAWSLAQQHPLTGWGLRNFSPLYQAQMQYFIGHPHNLMLMLAAETGFPATLLFVGLVGWLVAQGSRLLYQWHSSAALTSDRDALLASSTLLASSLKAAKDATTPDIYDRLMLFSYLIAFGGCALFSLLDITLFDVRINLLGWLLLSAIAGVGYGGKAEGERLKVKG